MVGRQERRRRGVARDRLRVVEVVQVVASTAAECGHEREGLASTAGATDPLLIVEPLRRHICLVDRLQSANVDADFHCGRHRQHVDFLRLAVQARHRSCRDCRRRCHGTGAIFQPASEFGRSVPRTSGGKRRPLRPCFAPLGVLARFGRATLRQSRSAVRARARNSACKFLCRGEGGPSRSSGIRSRDGSFRRDARRDGSVR